MVYGFGGWVVRIVPEVLTDFGGAKSQTIEGELILLTFKLLRKR